ncbi:MAG: ATP-binding protein [Bacteroidota bacterium]
MDIYTKHIIATSQWSFGIFIFGVYAVVFVFVLEKFTAEIKHITTESASTIVALREEYIRKFIQLQEEDRKRLSEELHDNIMSRFHLMRLNLFDGNIASLKKNLKRTMEIVRELSHNFAPFSEDTSELSTLLEDYIFQLKNQLHITYNTTSVASKEMLPANVKCTVFRIFQELVSNILKHSNATAIEIQLRHSKYATVLLVKDNGCGFDLDKASQGIGLKNIKYRAEIIKSRYKFKTFLGKYTMFIIFIPHYNPKNYE